MIIGDSEAAIVIAVEDIEHVDKIAVDRINRLTVDLKLRQGDNSRPQTICVFPRRSRNIIGKKARLDLELRLRI